MSTARRPTVHDVPEPTTPSAVLEHIHPGTDLIVPLANGEPVVLFDAIEAHAGDLEDVKVHQMHAVHDRPYLHGAFGSNLRHISYFLSHVTRQPFRDGTIDLVPNNFSEMRNILMERTRDPLVLAAASLPDRHGYFSLGLNADYVASFIGRARFFLESNARMPRTFGRNQIHESQVLGWVEADYPLVEVAPPPRTELDDRIACVRRRAHPQPGHDPDRHRIDPQRDPRRPARPSGARRPHRAHLGRPDGPRRARHRQRCGEAAQPHQDGGHVRARHAALYDFLDENTAFELWPVRYVNDPRVIAQEEGFVSINSTISVDLMGQCASETVHGEYYSSSGGQADFARGAMYSKGGQGFVVLRSTAKGGTVSKIVAELEPGDVVTTLKNTVDKVVTEWGVAELRGRSLRERAAALIGIAHPDHRDRLTHDARRLGHL